MTDLGGGLGLDYNLLRLQPGDTHWQVIGADLADTVRACLGPLAADVQHVGSTSVAGLLAKPIIDLAVGTHDDEDLGAIEQALTAESWIYRGDAGDEGGHLFVLESKPWVRVAHAHVVRHAGWQWNRYLCFRDHLRSSDEARKSYAAAKMALLVDLGSEGVREAYTERKTDVVTTLLDSAGWHRPN